MSEPRKFTDETKLESLIISKKYSKARKLAKEISQKKSAFHVAICNHASFWAEYGFVVRKTGVNEIMLLEGIRIHMIKCEDHNKGLDADWIRYDIIELIRNRDFKKAEIMQNQLKEMCRGDKNRLAAAKTIEGRLAYAKNKSDNTALSLFLDAEEMWREIKASPTNHLLMENKFHMLKSMVAKSDSGGYRYQIAREIRADDKNIVTRLRAWAIINFGRIGNNLDDLLMRSIIA